MCCESWGRKESDTTEQMKNNNYICHSFSSKEQAFFNFMAAVTICSYFGTQENKVCHCLHCFPIFCHEMMGPDAMILVF